MSHRNYRVLASAALLFGPLTLAHADPRVTAAYSTWDSLYFYAGFNVHDSNVVSTNDDLTSQPQQDDDIEVFLETDGARQAHTRTVNTYQMAVSAAGGAYFSEGNGSDIPVAKAIYDYKFDSTIDGTLNGGAGSAHGYTIELAIPWSELGMMTPPQAGTTWGFNVISHDRQSLQEPAKSFYSLSPLVKSRDDIQDPSKWTKITFLNPAPGIKSTLDNIVCQRVSALYPPVVDGVLRSGEYPVSSSFAFGDAPIEGASPTVGEEPNVKSADVAAPQAPSGTGLKSGPDVTLVPPQKSTGPSIPAARVAPVAPASPDSGYNIYLPSGGVVRVGKTPTPAPVPATAPTLPGISVQPPLVPPTNPDNPKSSPIVISPDVPVAQTDVAIPGAPAIDTTNPAPLVPQPRIGSRVAATYILDQPASPPIDSYLDQPADGLGNWFGAMRGQYVTDQLHNARLSGIEILLPAYAGTPTQVAALRSLVEAMKLNGAAGGDTPLLGLYLTGANDDYAAIASFFANVPPEFRAEVSLGDANTNKRAYVVVADHAVDSDALRAKFERDFAGKATLAITSTAGSPDIKIAVVSPGGLVNGTLAARQQTQSFEASWEAAVKSDPDWIVLNSWNDYANGTEIAISRQYSDQYANLTRVHTITWQGQKPWAAAFLQNDSPSLIVPKTLYEVHVRVENTGTLPWLASQSYSLSYRWYTKDGKLVDDSAPHIPLGDDILPGQSREITVGMVANNSYGTSIDPGDYYLVYDIVQGQHQWFSYTGNIPLKIPVSVLGPTDTAPDRLTFLSTNTPQFVKPDAVYYVTVRVRNDGSQTWNSGATTLVHTIAVNDETMGAPVKTTLSSDVPPGSVATIGLPIQIPSNAASGVTIGWEITNPDYKGGYTEHLSAAPVDPGAVFLLSDMSRHFKTGEKNVVNISIYNESPDVWKKADYRVGYHWAYLDGAPAGDPSTGPASLPSDVQSGQEVAVAVDVRAPEYPGRYNLVWDIFYPDGKPVIDSETIVRPRGLLPMQVWVTPGHDARALQVDLKAAFNERGVAFEGETSDGFDGLGAAIPGELLPPDGSREADGNPLLIGKAGPNYYPSGYYASAVGDGWSSNHRISFLFPGKEDNNVAASRGQLIGLPEGSYTAIHILAATSSSAPVNAVFGLQYHGTASTRTVPIAPWTMSPSTGGTLAFKAPYRLIKGAVDTSKPCELGDYVIAADPGKRLTGITLPNDPRVKILAVTAER